MQMSFFMNGWIEGMEIKRIKDTHWEVRGSDPRIVGVLWFDSQENDDKEAKQSIDIEAPLINKVDEAIDTLKSILISMYERDIYNYLMELEIKLNLQTVDQKLELLCLKHKNIKLAFAFQSVEWENESIA